MSVVADEILIGSPYLALRARGQVFRETVYGIVKRLRFLVEHVEAERHRRKLRIRDFRILDVGCGTGINVAIPLAEAGYQVVGIDTDHASIERAKQMAGDRPNSEFINSSLEQCGFTDRFHVVICSEVLEHLDQPDSLIRQMRSLLKDTGLLLVTIPNGYGYFELEGWLTERLPVLVTSTDRLQHLLVARFGSRELKTRHAREGKPEHWQTAWTSLAPDQAHCQRFTARRVQDLLTRQGFTLVAFKNRTFLAGRLLNNTVRDWDSFLSWNGRVADRLPHWAVSGWMLALRRDQCLDHTQNADAQE